MSLAISNSFLESSEALVGKYLGPICGIVAQKLLVPLSDSTTLRGLIRATNLKVLEVKAALGMLIQHDIVTFARDDAGIVHYKASFEQILRLGSRSAYVMTAKSMFGDQAGALMEELLLAGKLNHIVCVQKATEHLSELGLSSNLTDVQDAFRTLVNSRLIRRCPSVDRQRSEGSEVPIFHELPNEFPKPIFDAPADGGETSSEDHVWCVNFSLLDQYRRYGMIINFFEARFGKRAGELMAVIVQVEDLRSANISRSREVRLNHLITTLPENLGFNSRSLTLLFSLFAKDPLNIVCEKPDPREAYFIIDYDRIFTVMSMAEIENTIRCTVGPHAVRLFNILQVRGDMLEHELANIALLDSSRCKELLQSCVQYKYVFISEPPPSGKFVAKTKPTYFMQVNVGDTVLHLMDVACMAIKNATERRELENEANKELIARENKYINMCRKISAEHADDPALKEQHLNEIAETYVTSAEKKLLQKHRKRLEAFDALSINVDNSLFLFQTYLLYHPVRGLCHKK